MADNKANNPNDNKKMTTAEKWKAASEKRKADAEKKKKEQEAKKKADAKKRAEAKKKAEAKKQAEAKKRAEEKKNAPQKGIRYLTGLLFKKMAMGGAQELSNNADEVNKLNVFPVPDGDTGDNMKMTIESGVAAIEGLDTDNLAEVMHVLSHGMLLGARGNSGVILSQFFAGMAKGFEGIEQANPKALGKALEQGVSQAYASVMTPTEGTILTVARESVEYAVNKLHPQSTIKTFFQDLVDEMHASLDRTPEMLAALKEAEVVDSGGAGLLYIMDGFNQVLNGKDIPKEGTGNDTAKKPVSIVPGSFGPDSEMTFGYCTELLLQLQNKKCDPAAYDIEPLKAFLAGIGDSIVCFKTESIVKIHVHTFTPERVLEYCRSVGEFLTVKIENMSVQHTENITAEEAAEAKEDKKNTEDIPEKTTPERPKERTKYAVVSVCNGEGMINLFKELGTTEIVVGGQAHNPSTNDFIDAFNKINADNIFVFPNNGNIQMAAAQAAEMYTDAKVYVLPSKIVASGYIALATADFENEDPEAIYQGMIETIKSTATGYVSPAIRDTAIGGVQIANGDTIGIIGKEIVVTSPKIKTTAVALVDALLVDEGRFMITCFVGKDAVPEERAEIEAEVAKRFPNTEFYFIDGGQEIYPYIFLAE